MTSKLAVIAALVLGGAASMAAGNDTHDHEARATAPTPSSAMDHEHMARMKKDMAAIHSTTDPAEKQRLMEAHSQRMKASKGMMHGMMGHGQPAPDGGKHDGHCWPVP